MPSFEELIAALEAERDVANKTAAAAKFQNERLVKEVKRAREALAVALPAIAALAEASRLMDGFGPRRHTAEDSILAKVKSALTPGGNDGTK